MRKLVIGIAVVALLALMAVPAMAYEVTKDLDIQITVEEWGAIRFSDAVLALTVTEPWEGGAYGAAECKNTKDFTVLSNVACTLTVTAPEVTQAKNPPGAGYFYPVATYDGHKIGFGVTLRNLEAPAEMAWDHAEGAQKAYVSFSLGDIPDDLTSDNAQVQINSYMDSTRGDDALAPVGLYETYLILTLATP